MPELDEEQLASLKNTIDEKIGGGSCEDEIRKACMCKYHKYSEEEEIFLESSANQHKIELAACRFVQKRLIKLSYAAPLS